MKNLVLLFSLILSSYAIAQQTFNHVKVKELELPNEAASRASYIDGSGVLRSSAVSDTELRCLDGVTSLIQTQFDDAITRIDSLEASDTNSAKLTADQTFTGTNTFSGQLVTTSTTNGNRPCPVMTEAERDLV